MAARREARRIQRQARFREDARAEGKRAKPRRRARCPSSSRSTPRAGCITTCGSNGTGVLLSWAVTRGPSDDPAEKRLAVRTEDHPLSYGDFEGTIPQGEYGGGTVMMWDQGSWEPLHDPGEGLKSGMLHFRVHGQRMKGGWALIRMRPRGREKRENWLLVKERDDEATDEPAHLTDAFTASVATGRSMDAIAEDEASPVWHSDDPAGGAAKPAERQAPKRTGTRPKFRKPQLATLVDAAPQGDGWLNETKFDGYRCLVALGRGGDRFYTRSGPRLDGQVRRARRRLRRAALSERPARRRGHGAQPEGRLCLQRAAGGADRRSAAHLLRLRPPLARRRGPDRTAADRAQGAARAAARRP